VIVEPFHLRALGRQILRYNGRATRDNPPTDADRFALAVLQIVGKRLADAELTGKVGGRIASRQGRGKRKCAAEN
jgi:hypothetical protein